MIKLKKMRLKNFRSYDDVTFEFDPDINVIVGKNDVGKSTILEALEIFFNSEKSKIDIDDFCKHSTCGTNKMSITCCFDLEPNQEISIETRTTTCEKEFLFNQNKELEIKKEWDCSKDKLTTSSMKTYIAAEHPTTYAKKPLLLEKIASLKKTCKDLDLNIENVDKRVSSELRQSIYDANLVTPIDMKLIEIDISKEDAKPIYEKLSKKFPIYSLFESDRQNIASDGEIQNPLKAITKNVMADMQDTINGMLEAVKKEVEEIGIKTIEKLHELDPNIASNIAPIVTVKPIDSSFIFDLVSDDDIPLNKRGSGIRRLILLSYFRVSAEENTEHDRQIIYAIEEPETSQHPDYQKMILETFLELSEKDSHQIILTTHTPEIAKTVTPEQIIFVKKNLDTNSPENYQGDDKIRSIVATLGILPYVDSKLIVFVEGKFDIRFLTTINQNIPELKNLIDLKQEGIVVIPQIGSNLLEWITRDYLKDTNTVEFHIYDSDIPEYVAKIEEIKSQKDGRRYGDNTRLLEMENYIHPSLIQEEFKEDYFNLDYSDKNWVLIWSKTDVPKAIFDKNLKFRGTEKGESNIKRILNGKISKNVTKKHLEDLGVWQEVENWFKKIRDLFHGDTIVEKTTIEK